MSSITESNVDQFKTEHECDEHWELRRKFLLAHSDKFSLDEIICLAQVFTNVEFLGCRYPKETMLMISKLSKDIVQDYREKQKNRLRRTFVGASDAASSKVKGTPKPANISIPSSSIESPQKKYQELYSNFKRTYELSIKDRNSGNKKSKTISQKTNTRNIDDEIVLFEHCNDTPHSILTRAVQANNLDLEWRCNQVGNVNTCNVFFNNKKIAYAAAPNQKQSKQEASEKALAVFQNRYYTIKVTKNLTPTVTDNLGLQDDLKSNSDAISNDNIGSKMMKMMGWSGGGLGKSSQGITEPVNVQQQMTREGLGLKPGLYNIHVFKKKCLKVLQDYVQGDESVDLVFSPSFSNEERALVHQLANQLGLKSQSYGPKTQRILTISRKIRPRDLILKLIEQGGTTEKYQLIEPTRNQ